MLKRLLVAGGDGRMLRMAALLAGEGYEVRTLGLQSGDEREARVGEADALLFPFPFSVREEKVPALTGLSLYARDVLANARAGAALLAGHGLERFALEGPMLQKSFKLYTYLSDEALLERNAELSAEAALAQAMGRTDRALMDMTVLVTGYGRFGSALAHRLRALGAEVWVAARREAQRMAAEAGGMHSLALEDIAQAAARMDLVLNTVPAQVLDHAALAALPAGTWLLELASAPYGFDRAYAAGLGLKTEVLPALPARYAPQSAVMAMCRAAMKLLREAGV